MEKKGAYVLRVEVEEVEGVKVGFLSNLESLVGKTVCNIYVCIFGKDRERK